MPQSNNATESVAVLLFDARAHSAFEDMLARSASVRAAMACYKDFEATVAPTLPDNNESVYMSALLAHERKFVAEGKLKHDEYTSLVFDCMLHSHAWASYCEARDRGDRISFANRERNVRIPVN